MGLYWDLVIPAKPGATWPFQDNRGKAEKKPFPLFTAVPRILSTTLSFLLGGYGFLF